jgi:prepilin-type N-terminal cleavage/methylation domain-containing protein
MRLSKKARTRQQGFSLLEVLAALLILSVSIIALSANQTQSIRLIQSADKRATAVTLAQTKMAETNHLIAEKGLGEIKENSQGEFDQDLYPGYEWMLIKQRIPVPDFTSLMSAASGEVVDEEETQGNFEGPMKAVTELWGKGIKQVTVEVTWKERDTVKSYSLVTHYVESNVMQQVQSMMSGLGAGGSGDASDQEQE